MQSKGFRYGRVAKGLRKNAKLRVARGKGRRVTSDKGKGCMAKSWKGRRRGGKEKG